MAIAVRFTLHRKCPSGGAAGHSLGAGAILTVELTNLGEAPASERGSVQPCADSSDTGGLSSGCIHGTHPPPVPQSLSTVLDQEV